MMVNPTGALRRGLGDGLDFTKYLRAAIPEWSICGPLTVLGRARSMVLE